MTALLAQAKGPYSTRKRAGGFLFLSGQGAIDPATGEVAAKGIRDETRLTLDNIALLLAAEGYALSDLVDVTCYLTDLADWPALNEIYGAYLGEDARPTRTAVGVASLPFGLCVEITCIAYKAPG